MHDTTMDRICCFLAELIGTIMLMFLGCMGCVKSENFANSGLQMCLNFGLVVLIIIQCFGCVSGAHLNPSVTIAALIYDRISVPMAAVYIFAQILGCFIGYGLLKLALPVSAIELPREKHNLCVTAAHPDLTSVQGFIIEFFITAVLVIMCCAVWDPRNSKFSDSVSIRFGLAVACLSITAGPFTAASMNPARSFAPAVWNNDFEYHWIYWFGPLGGSVVAAYAYKFIFRREEKKEAARFTLRSMEEVSMSKNLT